MRRRRTINHLVLGIVVAALAAVATYLSTASLDSSPLGGGHTVRIAIPASGPIVKPGDDVRIAGVRVGQVRAVDLQGTHATATLAIGDHSLRADAGARVQLRGLAGAVDVELDPGTASTPLAAGASLPARAGTPINTVIAGFDAATRRALARTVSRSGAGLAGRGQTLNRVLGNLAPALEGLTPLLRAMRPGLGDFVVQADRVAAAVPRERLAGLLAGARPVVATAAARDGDIAATIDAVPPLEAQAGATLPVADRLLDVLRPTLRVLRPGIANLAAALPDLRAIEGQRQALALLARVGHVGAPVLRAAAPVAASLFPSTASLAALAAPAGRLASYLVPYGTELSEAPAGFTRWGSYTYDNGKASGHRAVRFTMVFTCANARDPYPAPGEADKEHKACRG